MAGQSAVMTIKEVSKTIKGLECNQHTDRNGASSGAETNQQVNHKGTQPPKRAK